MAGIRSAHARLAPIAFTAFLAAPATAQDWPALRGPNHDGSAPRGSTFGAEGGAMAVRWRAKLGSGCSGVSVSGGRAVTMFSDGARDVLAAFDAATGREAWRVVLGETHRGLDGSFNGPMSTPVIAGGRVFALGPRGHLVAVDLARGAVRWRVDVPRQMGAPKPHYGFASSPVVAGGVLVAQVGAGQGRATAGFDPASGERRWAVGEDGVHYQSPAVVRLGDREIVVVAGDTRLSGIDPATGRLVFDHPHGGALGEISVNTAVPLPAGDGRVFVKTHPDKSTMFRLVPAADGSVSVDTLWTAPVLRTTYAVPVYHDGHLYGMNGRTVLTCVDAATGEIKWRSREPGDGFPTLVGDRLVFVTKDRTLHVGPASPRGWSERARLELFDDLVWTAASVVGDAAFARSLGELARVDWTAAAATTRAAVRPVVASPTFARFLEDLDRALDKAAAVDRFLAGVGDGPLIDPPDRVVFLYRGDAKDVGIATDLIGIRREDPMPRVPGTDLFFYEARVEPAARINYQFVRDFGKPMPDPRNPRRVPALGPPGFGPADEASSLAMPGWSEPAHLAEAPEGRRGPMEKIEFSSLQRQGARSTLSVYVPSGYDAAGDRYPTVYVLDGDAAREQGLFARSLDNLMPEQVAPALVVFLGRMDWGARRPSPPEATAAAVELLVKEIVPLIDARFRTLAEPGARGVVGHAFGGITAVRAVFDGAGVFGALGLQSLLMLDTDEDDLNPRVRTAAERPLRVYHDWGLYGHRATREAADMRLTNRRFNGLLRAKGYAPAGGEAKDGFGWASWRNRTDRLFAALLPPR
jgi:enterochelin esterase-like enzyme/outer membrane protein assembly factor BamB